MVYLDVIKQINLYDSLCFAHMSWSEVTTETIINGFQKALENCKILENEAGCKKKNIGYQTNENGHKINECEHETASIVCYDEKYFYDENSDVFMENAVDNYEIVLSDEEHELSENFETNNHKRIITSFDAVEKIEELEDWIGKNLAEMLGVVLNLKIAIYNERKSRRKNIEDFLRLKK